MQELEAKIGSGGASECGGASFAELHQIKKVLTANEEELLNNEQIKKLEQEPKDALTLPQLQIEELDAENKALIGCLKAERKPENHKQWQNCKSKSTHIVGPAMLQTFYLQGRTP
jgi:hypothetical protein